MNTYSGVSGAIPFTRLKLKDFSLSFLYLLESNERFCAERIARIKQNAPA